MTDYETITARRVMTSTEADTLLGERVPELEPNVTRPTVVRDADTGAFVAAYLPLADRARLRRAVIGMPMTGVQRSAIFRSRSRTFGAAPRKPAMRRDACRMTALYVDEPERHRVLEEYATVLGDMLKEVEPAQPDKDREILGVVMPEWRMGNEQLWTSGVVNQSAALPYHRDNFNFKTVSAMPVVRRGMRGGHLHIPEYALTLACTDGTASFFCGRELVHGVTPLQPVAKDGYRYSVVYYALRGMKDCFTAAEESAFGRRKRTEREREMARRLATGDTSFPGQNKTPKETP